MCSLSYLNTMRFQFLWEFLQSNKLVLDNFIQLLHTCTSVTTWLWTIFWMVVMHLRRHKYLKGKVCESHVSKLLFVFLYMIYSSTSSKGWICCYLQVTSWVFHWAYLFFVCEFFFFTFVFQQTKRVNSAQQTKHWQLQTQQRRPESPKVTPPGL